MRPFYCTDQQIADFVFAFYLIGFLSCMLVPFDPFHTRLLITFRICIFLDNSGNAGHRVGSSAQENSWFPSVGRSGGLVLQLSGARLSARSGFMQSVVFCSRRF